MRRCRGGRREARPDGYGNYNGHGDHHGTRCDCNGHACGKSLGDGISNADCDRFKHCGSPGSYGHCQ